MLIFNPKRIFALRGIEKPHRTLVKAGISPATATKILKYYSPTVTIAHLEKICALLNCTPNDLFEFRADDKSSLHDKHALHTLRKEKDTASIKELIEDVPLEKLSEMKEMLLEIKNRE